jgi:type II restriction enzyme
MNYDLSQGHKFYEYRIVNFLVEAALGMTSKAVWSGKYDVVGGIIIVKPDAELLCYHLIDFNKFKHYLKNASRLDNPSGSRMGYGSVYIDEAKSFIKLNFQIKA